MRRIALPLAPDALVKVLTDRGARLTTGDDVRTAVAAISPLLHGGDVDAVLLVHAGGRETDLVDVWARSLAEFAPARFVGIGKWGPAVTSLEAGCSLTDLLTELGLEPEAGDDTVTVRADGTLDGATADSAPDQTSAAAGEGRAEPPAPDVREAQPETGSPAPWGARGRIRPRPPASSTPALEQPKRSAPWGASRPHEHDWSGVLFLVSGRGGVGRSTMSVAIAERAASHLGRNVVLVDANVGQAGLATNLRAIGDTGASRLPTIADLRTGASVQQVVTGPDDLRRAGGVRIGFACVLAPDPDQATAAACSPDRYRQVIDELTPVSDLVVVDTCVAWQSDPTGITDGLITPGLQAGASILVVTDPSLEGVAGARRLVSWATRLAPGRVSGLLNKVPPSAAVLGPTEASTLFSPAPCLGAVTYSESVAVAAARARPIGRLTALAADKVLTHLGIS
ncbi:hypothetical protein [Actinomyces gaoshouyii]|uniref:hypothetical protein n=1 Tax=Actinomyces gaoshouyii TaxID=1960083 RepID=UPI0009C033FF|nr:hypothetical protein [Actinomyces gaoshouyii]ARD42457.1 hypothetical protein B6G06_09010 [Actinomyces gaoshouyii]